MFDAGVLVLALLSSPAITATTAVSVRIGGYVQMDAVLHDQSSRDEVNPSTGEPLNDTRVLIRRARLRASTKYEFLSGGLELDANTVRGPAVRVIAADVSAQWGTLFVATIGLFKTPFGFEVQEKTEGRRFMEAGNAARALFAGDYDLGIRIQGSWEFLRYQLGAMNGAPIGDRQFPGRDPNESRDFVGRLGISADVFAGVRVDAGFSALLGRGFHRGAAATEDQIVWRDVNENGSVELSELQAIAGTAGTPSQNFDRSCLGADLRITIPGFYGGEFFVFGELFWAVNLDRALIPADPVAAGRDLRERGFTVGLAGRVGEYFSAGARFDYYNPDAGAADQQGPMRAPSDRIFSTLAIFSALLLDPWGKLMIEYDVNGNPFGRTAEGEVTTLADNTLTLRAQLGF